MFRCILSHLINMSLEDMISVHVRHFRRILQPNLVFRVLRQVVEGSDVQGEFAAFGEFTEANTDRSQIIAAHI